MEKGRMNAGLRVVSDNGLKNAIFFKNSSFKREIDESTPSDFEAKISSLTKRFLKSKRKKVPLVKSEKVWSDSSNARKARASNR